MYTTDPYNVSVPQRAYSGTRCLDASGYELQTWAQLWEETSTKNHIYRMFFHQSLGMRHSYCLYPKTIFTRVGSSSQTACAEHIRALGQLHTVRLLSDAAKHQLNLKGHSAR